MKIVISSALILASFLATAQAQVISWNDNNGNNIPADGFAGVVSVTNWNNSTTGMANLIDNSGIATTAGFSISGTWGAWGIFAAPQDGDGTYNKRLLGGYANTSSGIGPEVFSITNIPYSSYDLIVYFSSDTAGRTGTISNSNAGIKYDFTTIGPPSITGSVAVLTQTTDTTGANPLANYAIFSNLGGSSASLALSIPDGGGIAGFQIVAVPEPSTLALVSLGGLGLWGWRRRKVKF